MFTEVAQPDCVHRQQLAPTTLRHPVRRSFAPVPHSAAPWHRSADSRGLWRQPHSLARAASQRCVRNTPLSQCPPATSDAPCFLSAGTSASTPEERMTVDGLVPFGPFVRGGMGVDGPVPRFRRYQVRRLMPSAFQGSVLISAFSRYSTRGLAPRDLRRHSELRRCRRFRSRRRARRFTSMLPMVAMPSLCRCA
jgi:hypothetical protein